MCGTTFATATATAATACVRSQETDDASGASANDTRATKLSLSLRFRHEHSHTHRCKKTNTNYVNAAAAVAAWSFKALERDYSVASKRGAWNDSAKPNEAALPVAHRLNGRTSSSARTPHTNVESDLRESV